MGKKYAGDTFWDGRSSQPALNIKETDDNFEIGLAAPSFGKKDFNLTIEDGFLNISSEKKSSEEEKVDNHTRREFSYNSYERSLQFQSKCRVVLP